jgi:hypothetical protein
MHLFRLSCFEELPSVLVASDKRVYYTPVPLRILPLKLMREVSICLVVIQCPAGSFDAFAFKLFSSKH